LAIILNGYELLGGSFMQSISITHDLEYLAIFALVLILPKVFMRARIPGGITALCIGLLVGFLDPAIKDDQLFRFLSQIGITSLFVFAGLEVNFKELKGDKVYLSKYLIKSTIALFAVAWGVFHVFELTFQSSLILSLGFLTPSAGYIITSLQSYNVEKEEGYWIKSKAISREIIAIILLFVALQINDLPSMAISLAFFVALFLIMPIIFRLFFKFVSPYAPNSEIQLLVVLSLISGVISKELGAYYLVGAFIVGLIGSRFKKHIFKEGEDFIFKALNSFFNVFLPFYFFYAGSRMPISAFSIDAMKMGVIFMLIFVPLRLLLNSLSIKYFFKDLLTKSYKISFSLMPTLIFGLVIAGILKEKGQVPDVYIFALIIYTILASLLPTVLFSFQKEDTAPKG
jgi:Kef-type K+ transport system membrane component KefB